MTPEQIAAIKTLVGDSHKRIHELVVEINRAGGSICGNDVINADYGEDYYVSTNAVYRKVEPVVVESGEEI